MKYCLSAEALCRLNNVIRHPNALDSDNVMAYDNAVSALGKICQFHRDNIDAAQVFQYCFCMYISTLNKEELNILKMHPLPVYAYEI